MKIEDVVAELKEYDTFLKTKEQMKKDGEKKMPIVLKDIKKVYIFL